MSRLFSLLIFDGTIRGNSEVYTNPKLNELLGSADRLILELEVAEAAGTSPTLTARLLHSAGGDDLNFKARTAFVSGVSLASLPYRDVVVEGSTKIAGTAKVGFQLGNSDNVIRLRAWATGRV